MKTKLFTLTVLLSLVGCFNGDKTIVITNEDRVTELERRADLNDQVDALQASLIEANSQGIVAVNQRIDDLDLSLRQLVADEAAAREAADQNLQDSLDAETAAREAGDVVLANQIAAEAATRQLRDQQIVAAAAAAVVTQTLVNLAVQYQISQINSKFPVINNKLNSLQSQVNNANSSISSLQSQINDLQVDLADLDARLLAAEGDISSLSDSLDDLQLQVDQEGVKVFKCNAASSKERILKINNKFYAVMNHVTKQTVQVVTGASSQNYATPLLCKNNGNKLKLANNGSCNGNGWSILSGTGLSINVPSNTTSNVSVVTGVQMALEPLTDGSYQTTDGNAACTFSVSGGGSVGNNLIQVQ